MLYFIKINGKCENVGISNVEDERKIERDKLCNDDVSIHTNQRYMSIINGLIEMALSKTNCMDGEIIRRRVDQ